MLPDPDDETTRRLISEATIVGEAAAAEMGAAIMSAVVAYLIGGVGSEQTAKILRDWAAAVMRREMRLPNAAE
jgi:predicted PP-loop superfamily ATPase